jgi:methylenetetrahydrofolate--tRNA-(uracil-5-)-methyltransferase
LAVDRDAFARMVTDRIEEHPGITVRREEVEQIPVGQLVVVATGPLTSPALADALATLTGSDSLYFYDAMAPIVTAESVDMNIAFRASRYDQGQGDYLNCPLSLEEYERFVQELLSAETIALRDFEREDPRFFEACLPVEVLASRGHKALAFGPLKPVGLVDPRTGRRPYAVVQLRQDNLAATLYNLVGFQTNLKWAEIARFGQMHRNTFINAPELLRPTMQFRKRDDLFFAGQITGTEGYVGSAASGFVAGLNAARILRGQLPISFPPTTMIGALSHYICHASPNDFQPMKANFGLFPSLQPPVRGKRERYAAYARRALIDLERFVLDAGIESNLPVAR